MTAEDLGPVIKQAQSGDAEAFIALVATLQRDIRVLVATYGSSQSMVDHTVCKIWSHCRAHLDECPASCVAPSWFRTIACLYLQQRLEADLEMVRLHDDQLQLIIIQAALSDLKNTLSPSNAQGLQVRDKLNKIDSQSRLLLEQRYGQNFSLVTNVLPRQANLTSTAAAISLFLARDRLDWTNTQQVSLAGIDGQFSLLIDEYLSGQISPQSCNRLMTMISQDSLRRVQLERQLRLDLVLTALLNAAGTDQARALVGRLETIPITSTNQERIASPDPASNRPESVRSAKRPSSGMIRSITTTRRRSKNRSRGILLLIFGASVLMAVFMVTVLVQALSRPPSAITFASVPNSARPMPRTIVAISCGGQVSGRSSKTWTSMVATSTHPIRGFT